MARNDTSFAFHQFIVNCASTPSSSETSTTSPRPASDPSPQRGKDADHCDQRGAVGDGRVGQEHRTVAVMGGRGDSSRPARRPPSASRPGVARLSWQPEPGHRDVDDIGVDGDDVVSSRRRAVPALAAGSPTSTTSASRPGPMNSGVVPRSLRDRGSRGACPDPTSGWHRARALDHHRGARRGSPRRRSRPASSWRSRPASPMRGREPERRPVVPSSTRDRTRRSAPVALLTATGRGSCLCQNSARRLGGRR